MEDAPKAAVTPAGVRDGEPEALRGLVRRRGSAVLAFCQAVCDPEVADVAAAEAFARFRGAVAAADDPGGLNPEVLLVGATRHAAAQYARTSLGGGGLRGRFGRGRGEKEPLCSQVPELLAQRADDMLGPVELDRLAAHLERDAGCREIEAAFRRAERAYRSPPELRLGDDRERALLAALAGAAPLVAPGSEQFLELLEPEWDDEDGWVTVEDDLPSATELAVADLPQTEVHQLEPEPELDPAPFVDDAAEAERQAAERKAAEEAVLARLAAEEAERQRLAAEQAEAERLEAERREADRVAAELAEAERRAAEEAELHHAEPAPRDDEDDVDPFLIGPEEPTGSGHVDHGTLEGAPLDAAPAHYPAGLPRTRRRPHLPHIVGDDHGPVFNLVLPGAAIIVAVIIILAIAGVFGGDDPAPGAPGAVVQLLLGG